MCQGGSKNFETDTAESNTPISDVGGGLFPNAWGDGRLRLGEIPNRSGCRIKVATRRNKTAGHKINVKEGICSMEWGCNSNHTVKGFNNKPNFDVITTNH